MFEQYIDNFIDDELFPNGKIFRIVFDNVTAKFRILAKSRQDLSDIVDAFSTTNTASFFTRQYGFNTESKNYTVNKFGYFSIGLIFEMFNYIKREFGSLECLELSKNVKRFIVDQLMPLKRFSSSHDREKFAVSNISEKYQLREYQTNAIKSLIFDGCGRGLIELPTGSGKSFVIANFIYTIFQQYDSSLKTLIFVPNRQLVDQFYKDLLDYGFKKEEITKLASGLKKNEKYDPNAKIIVSNRQYLFTNAEKLPKIDIFVGDEAHSISDPNSNTYKFVENLNCPIKIGCSGTLPRDTYKKWSLIGLFSRIIYTEDIVKLQNEGHLSKLEINVLSITDKLVERDVSIPFNLKSTVKYFEGGDIAFNESYNAEVEYTNKNCLRLYTPMVKKIELLKGNVLILFDRIEFGRELFDTLKDLKPRNSEIYYIDGSTQVEEREKIRALLETSNNNVLVANAAVMSTGINIKNLPNLCFTGGGKSITKCIQSIGRTLRLHQDKEKSIVLDCVFNFKYSRKHFRERLNMYRDFYKKQKPDLIEKIDID